MDDRVRVDVRVESTRLPIMLDLAPTGGWHLLFFRYDSPTALTALISSFVSSLSFLFFMNMLSMMEEFEGLI